MAEDRGRASPPDSDAVRAALLHFADLIRRLEEEGKLLQAIPLLLGRLGDLRQLLFDYEVRVTERLLPIEDPIERESRRVVRDASSRGEELVEEWKRGFRIEELDEDPDLGV